MVRKLLSDNFILKLTSLALAIFLETYFYSPDNSITDTFILDASVVDLDPSMMMVEPRDRRDLRVELRVKGPSPLVHQAKERMLNLPVKLPKPIPSSMMVDLDKLVVLPLGVTLLDVNPRQMKLSFEKVAQKVVRVEASETGKVANGFRIDSTTVNPVSVVVTGPESEVSKLSVLKTEPVEVDGLSSPQSIDATIADQSDLISYSATVISVRLDIKPELVEKTFIDVSVRVVAPDGYAASVEPSKVLVKLHGPKNAVGVIQEFPFSLIADARNLISSDVNSDGTFDVVLTHELGKDISVVETLPSRVTVKLVANNSVAKEGVAKDSE